MCGILGFIGEKVEPPPMDFENLQSAFKDSSMRGNQACGIWSEKTGLVKEPGGYEEFLKKHRKKLLKASSSLTFLGHTRAATGETHPENNNNNHPHESKNWVLIHNGVIDNSPRVKGYKYNGECDSEIFLSYVETFGFKRACELSYDLDSWAIVAVHKPTQDVWFVRNKNPIVVSRTLDSQGTIFGSTLDIVLSLSNWEEKSGFGTYLCTQAYTVKERKIFHLNRATLEWETEEISPRDSKTFNIDKFKTELPQLMMEEYIKAIEEKEKKHWSYPKGNQIALFNGRHDNIGDYVEGGDFFVFPTPEGPKCVVGGFQRVIHEQNYLWD